MASASERTAGDVRPVEKRRDGLSIQPGTARMTAPQAPLPAEGAAAERALYVYCFALAERVPAVDPPLCLLREGAVTAVVREVPLADFTGPEAEERAGDLAWIGPRALEHNRVIEGVWRRSPVFPLPFGTLYSVEEALRRFTARHEGTIASFLARVGGAGEWAAKGFLDKERAAEALGAPSGGSPSSSPGARYLQERKARQEGDRELGRRLEAAGGEIERALSAVSLEFRERRPLATQDEPGRRMIFNWAFLVEEGRAQAFTAVAEELGSTWEPLGLDLRLSGPLPPYSFVPPLAEPGGRP
jgi:hypothetical protein